MTTPPVAIGSAMNRVTPEERQEFDCALRHVMETYKLPRYHAADVAIRLLSLGQPAWSPFPCQHPAKHDDRTRRPIAFTCTTARGCGSLIRPGPGHDEKIHPHDFCFICGAPLEARYESITDVDGSPLPESAGVLAGVQGPPLAVSVGDQVVAEGRGA